MLTLLLCLTANTAQAVCPGDRDDGKRVTLTATGMFIRCDWLIEYYKEDGDLDIVQAGKVACR